MEFLTTSGVFGASNRGSPFGLYHATCTRTSIRAPLYTFLPLVLRYSAKQQLGAVMCQKCRLNVPTNAGQLCSCFYMLSCPLLSVMCLCTQLTTGHRVALSTIGYVGCSISIFCLAITLVTFAVLS